MRNINIDSVVYYKESIWRVESILSLDKVTIINNEKIKTDALLSELKLLSDKKTDVSDLMEIEPNSWKEAERRYNIIKGILFTKCSRKLMEEIGKENNTSVASLYRWKEKYESSNGKLTSLLPKHKNGGRGLSRLSEVQESIILKVINEYYLTPQRRSLAKTYEELKLRCRSKEIECPSLNTLRKRIESLSESERLKSREGKKLHDERYNPKTEHFPNGNYPLQTVQIDHTPVDLIVIDEETGEPIGRPWLTLAIDVYSRMIVGYNLGFEDPSILTTGICISNAILPKEKILKKFNIETEWPCWGIMKSIHTDNGSDFTSEAISRACAQYGIDLDLRPPGNPSFGGHIERLMGTFSKEFHSLSGTTFNNISKRRNYNSAKKAVFTIEMLEEYIVTFITEVYHQKKHSGINTSPLFRYKEGIWGNDQFLGIGIPALVDDEEKLQLDFLPYFERTVQNYGVSIDSIFYYSEVLRPFIHKTQFASSKGIKREKMKFIFRRDPRDISKLFFWDPELKRYFKIPYSNTTNPPISLWELRAIKRKLKLNDDQIDEELIFNALRKLKNIEEKASKNKKSFKRKQSNNLTFSSGSGTRSNFDDFGDVDFDNIKPF